MNMGRLDWELQTLPPFQGLYFERGYDICLPESLAAFQDPARAFNQSRD